MKYKISMIEQKPKENKKESLIDINEFKKLAKLAEGYKKIIILG